MNPTQITIFSVFLGIILTLILVWSLQRFRNTARYKNSQSGFVKILKWEERAIHAVKNVFNKKLGSVTFSRENIEILGEILLIGVWAFWVGRDYLDFNPYMWPTGREVGIQIATHQFWTQLKECGSCVLWNGSINGGSPAFADPFSPVFHPLTAVTTLLFGVINGVKIATLITLWIAGIAQWGIAKLLNTRRLVRLWSAALAVVAGHIVGKLELGAFVTTLSTTMASVTFLCLVLFITKNSNKTMVYLAFSISLLILSGNGYMQVAVLSFLPVLFFLLIKKMPRTAQWKFFGAILLGLLMASFIIIPIIHFSPNIQKFTDNDGNLTQSLEYIPLNLVIHEWDFYITGALNKPPYPYLTNIYIGWVPVILAVLSFILRKKDQNPILYSFTWAIPFFLFLASGIPFQWISKVAPEVSGIRHTQIIAGMLGFLIIGISSHGLEELFQLQWPTFNYSSASGKKTTNFSFKWLILIPLVLSIYTCYEFNRPFLKLTNIKDVYQTISEVDIENPEWFSPPFGDHWWVLPSIEHNLKITNTVTPWWWKDREKPKALLIMTKNDPLDDYKPYQTANGFPTYINQQNRYAYIDTGNQQIPCPAKAEAGRISVFCDTDYSGKLIITENNWTGWQAWRDGIKINIYGGQWINVQAPAGKHIFTFRYKPWDVPVGAFLSLMGLVICIIIWFSPSQSIDNIIKRIKPKQN